MNKEIRRDIWLNGALGLLALGLLVAAYVWWHQKPELWPFVEEHPELSKKITEIQDIEHLRKVSLLLVQGSNKLARDGNEAVARALDIVIALLLLISLIGLLNAVSLIKHARRLDGRPIGWLRWL